MNKEQYVTITYYKEREFYFLNYAFRQRWILFPKRRMVNRFPWKGGQREKF